MSLTDPATATPAHQTAAPPIRAGALYGPLAVGLSIVATLPLLRLPPAPPVNSDGLLHGSLIHLALQADAPPIGAPGLLTLAGLVGCLTTAAIRPTVTARVPAGIALLGALLAVVLAIRPSAGPPAELAQAGRAGLVMACMAAVVGLLHAVAVLVRSRR